MNFTMSPTMALLTVQTPNSEAIWRERVGGEYLRPLSMQMAALLPKPIWNDSSPKPGRTFKSLLKTNSMAGTWHPSHQSMAHCSIEGQGTIQSRWLLVRISKATDHFCVGTRHRWVSFNHRLNSPSRRLARACSLRTKLLFSLGLG